MTEVYVVFHCLLIYTLIHSTVLGIRFWDPRELDSRPMPPPPPLRTSHQLSNSSQLAESMFSPWSNWGPCSGTCGYGLAKRVRTCKRSSLSSGIRKTLLCHGETVEHRICSVKPCPLGEPDFRTFQCLLYNNRSVGGQKGRKWRPASGGSNPCELRCESVGDRMIYGFGKAADGTVCQDKASSGPAICLDGRCLVVGCDKRLGSGAEIDMCGVCGGRNATCVHYKDVFYGQPSVKPGEERIGEYQEVVVIPVGARHLEFRQPIGSNILAMRDRNTGVIFHGEQVLSKFYDGHHLAGTLIYYKRVNNKTEVLKAEGPTTLQLHVLVLLRDRNPGIYYEYWIPLEQSRSLKPYFAYEVSTVPSTYGYTTVSSSTIRTSPKSTVFPSSHRAFSIKDKKAKIEKSTQKYTQSTPSPPISFTNYGPKRSLISWKHLLLTTDKTLDTTVVTSTPSPTAGIYDITPLPVYRPKFFYRTKTPPMNYYQTFRNTSYSKPKSIYQQPVNHPLQTQRDASGIEDHWKISKDGSFKKKKKIRHPQLVDSSEENKVLKQPVFTSFDSKEDKFNSRWSYSISQAKNDSWRTSFDKHRPQSSTTVSVAVLPLPENDNDTKNRRKGGIKYQLKPKPIRKGVCGPCHRVRDQTKHFCSSDFVIRALVMGYEFLHGETRYELEILQTFKNTLALLPREYVWAPDTCNCPKLRVGKEYVLMGRSDNTYRRNESRLLIDKSCFVRMYKPKHARRLHKLRREQAKKCTKIS